MTFKPNYADPNNWESLSEKLWTRQIADGDIIVPPIGRVLYPYLINSAAIVVDVEVTAPENTQTWSYGGKALISINTGITVGGNTDTVVFTKSLFLHQNNLLVFPNLAGDFRLEYSPPKWFGQVTLRVWQYIGAGIPDTPGKLDAIAQLITA